MASFWKRFTTHLSYIWKGAFVQTIEALIQNTRKSIGETSNVFLKILKVLWLLILIIVLAITLLFKNLFRLIKRLFIVVLEEINFYVARIAGASKNLNKQWGGIVLILTDIKDFLVNKINDDNASFSDHFRGNAAKLIFWDFPIANIVWLFWFALTLTMSILLFVSIIIVFPPIIHRVAREAILSAID
ncbi:MAG: hypothetical protein DPW18_17585 [Chloroflexi bacterium]|nr:hypothetical protein [Chloroflexota bacterium]MDL1943001.1 hypothetical protein [Chloroflexi bacterium CFX2]